MYKNVLSSLFLMLGIISHVNAAPGNERPNEKLSRAEDRATVAVTIYNESLALVREERDIFLDQGRNSIAMREVSAKIKPETASLRSLSGGRFTLFEQNFDFDLLTPQALLDKYVGKTVTIIHKHPQTGEEKHEQAIVLANNQGVVLRFADRIETGVSADARISYADVPSNLRDRPTLVIDLENDRAGKQRTELSYLTKGFSWKADYVAALADNEETLDLAGWVTLVNRSGASYENARLQLVAGDVNRVLDELVADRGMVFEAKIAQEAAGLIAREELFEYHLYTLARPTTLRDNQIKQVALLSANDVNVRKEYRLNGAAHWYQYDQNTRDLSNKRQVEVFIEFDNKGGDLGQPLPKGIVRVYKEDREGRPLFIGEDRIDHTPKNETVRLKLGKAFDITGNWKRIDYASLGRRSFEQEIAIELKNAKKIPAIVKVIEPIPGDWKMIKENFPHQKAEANTAVWNIEVPAESSKELKYRVRSTW